MLSKKHTKVAIIGDHSMTRLGLVTYIQALPQFEVVFDCGDAEYALIAVESKRTDIMLIDIHLPNMNGAEFVRQLRAKQPHIKTLMINAYDTALATVIAQEAGASGVFSKNAPSSELTTALNALAKGEGYWPTLNSFPVTEEEAEAVLADDLPVNAQKAPLSPREMEVFQLLGSGKVTKQIAAALGLSGRTVDVHRANIKRKLGVKSGSEMMQLASLAYWVSSRSIER